jgi:hypothetical protein
VLEQSVSAVQLVHGAAPLELLLLLDFPLLDPPLPPLPLLDAPLLLLLLFPTLVVGTIHGSSPMD